VTAAERSSSRRALSLETHNSVRPLEAEWDALADRTGASVFARPGWIDAWYSAFVHGEPLVAALRRGGELVAVAALEAQGPALRSATNWHTPAYDLVAEGADDARALADAVLRLRPRRLDLRFVDADGLAAPAFGAAAAAADYRILTRPLEESPYIPVTGDWDAYAKTLRKKMLQDLARQRRRLEEDVGPLSVTVETGGTGLEEAMEKGFRLEAAGWKGRGGTAIVSRPETHAFYTAVARWAAERGWLRLAFLSVGDRPIAFEFGLEENGAVYNLKPGYDESYARYGPGGVLTEHIVRGAFERGVRSYEFLGDADPYKLRWARFVRQRLVVQAFAPTPAGRADFVAFRFGRPAVLWALSVYRRAGARLRR
jgi:CelD/BcsL family acetyltransferase involved in cellulose biosynthesis